MSWWETARVHFGDGKTVVFYDNILGETNFKDQNYKAVDGEVENIVSLRCLMLHEII